MYVKMYTRISTSIFWSLACSMSLECTNTCKFVCSQDMRKKPASWCMRKLNIHTYVSIICVLELCVHVCVVLCVCVCVCVPGSMWCSTYVRHYHQELLLVCISHGIVRSQHDEVHRHITQQLRSVTLQVFVVRTIGKHMHKYRFIQYYAASLFKSPSDFSPLPMLCVNRSHENIGALKRCT